MLPLGGWNPRAVQEAERDGSEEVVWRASKRVLHCDVADALACSCVRQEGSPVGRLLEARLAADNVQGMAGARERHVEPSQVLGEAEPATPP